MDRSPQIEIAVGVFLAAGFLALFFLALQATNFRLASGMEGYTLMARFENIGTLRVRAPVTMAGVRIGRVADIRFDPNTYEAVVTLRIDPKIRTIPDDTFASIYTSGLLGEQYVGLSPGGSDRYLQDGDTFANTQSALILEQMIGQFLFKSAEEAVQ